MKIIEINTNFLKKEKKNPKANGNNCNAYLKQ
jgi:hypothetical protein